MRNSSLVAALLLAATIVAVPAGAARAGYDDEYEIAKSDWPLRYVDRPLVIAAGMLSIEGDTFLLNLSKDAVAKPFAFAPDVFYGVSKLLSVGVTHQTGICPAGADNGCPSGYTDVGVEAIYALMRGGSFEVAGRGGLILPSIDPFAMGLRAGLETRIHGGNLTILASPSLYLGMIGRDEVAAAPTKEYVALPVEVSLQIQNQTAVLLTTGIDGPLSGFGDSFRVPVGVGGVFALNNRADLGVEFRFTNMAGKGGGADGRMLIARLALRI